MRVSPTNPIIAQRLTQLRKKNNYTQKQVITMLSEMTPATRQTRLSDSVVSQWEKGARTPAFDMLNLLAKLYQVTPDYIMGATDDPQGHSDKSIDYKAYRNMQPVSKTDNDITEIPMSEINLFDGFPVFIYFKNLQHSDQWGIVNFSKKAFILRNGLLDINDPSILKICTDKLAYRGRVTNCSNTPLDYSRLLTTTGTVWVEVTSPDTQVQSLYNGWYKHNENKSCLVNALGLALPYEGVRISYNAYTKRMQ